MGYFHLCAKGLALLTLCLFSFLSFAQLKEQWVKRYNGPGNGSDEAFSMTVDASGNVYVAGLSAGGKTLGDYVIIKYHTAGNILWERRYNGPGNGYDKPCSIAADAQGNLYVTGVSLGKGGASDMDYATIKYDASGNVLWTKRYNGPANNWDEATCLAIDASGNVYVSGTSYGHGTDYDCVTLKYDREGNQLWEKRYNGPGNDMDRAISTAVDGSGNVYVAGNCFVGGTLDFLTIKYDAAGQQVWVKRYSGTQNSYDSGTCIAVDSFGDVCVTGYSIGQETDYDFVTIKYDASGNELLSRRYNGEGNSIDIPSSLFVDADGNIYVTGSSKSAGTSDDYLTIKYNRDGQEQWIRSYNGRASGIDYAFSLFVDTYGNVYVTGTSQVGIEALAYDYVTIQYDKNGNERWSKRYNGSKNMNDGAKSIVVDGNGNVYVTGFSAGSVDNTDIVTIKYGQTSVADVRCGKNGERVLVCHNGKTLCIAQSAVAAHLKHGDQLGSCNTSTSLNSTTGNKEAAPSLEKEVKYFQVSVSPNPFSTTAKVQYALPFDGTVVIKVYNMNGREFTTVVQGEQKAGVYVTNFNAKGLMKGAYYYKAVLTTHQKSYTQTGKRHNQYRSPGHCNS